MNEIRDPESEWGQFRIAGAVSLSPPPATGVMWPSMFPSQPDGDLPQLSLLTSDVPEFPFIWERSLNEASPPMSPLQPALPRPGRAGGCPTCSPAAEGQVHDSSLLVPAPIVTFRHQALAKQSARDRNWVPERRWEAGGTALWAWGHLRVEGKTLGLGGVMATSWRGCSQTIGISVSKSVSVTLSI